MADDDIAATAHAKLILARADAFARCGMARKSYVRIVAVDDEVGFERDQTGHSKDYCARAIIAREGIPQTTRSAVIEICHFHHHSSAPATRKPPITFRARKRQMPGAESPEIALGDTAGGVHLIHPPPVGQQAG